MIIGEHSFTVVKDIVEGNSKDKKYYVEDSEGNKFCLRLSNSKNHDNMKSRFRLMTNAFELGVPMLQPIEFGFQEDSPYILSKWVEGVTLTNALKSMTESDIYLTGVKAGEALRKLHNILLPSNLEEWSLVYMKKARSMYRKYSMGDFSVPEMEKLFAYIQSNDALLFNRPQRFLHGNFDLSNIIINNNKITVIDFNSCTFGDPWSEFSNLMDCNPMFSLGQIHGYFNGEPPEEFFALFPVYLYGAIMRDIVNARLETMDKFNNVVKICKSVIGWFDDMQSTMPFWYVSHAEQTKKFRTFSSKESESADMKIYVVSKNEPNTYHTVQSAVDAVRDGSESLIYIKPGIYTEKIVIGKSNLTLVGESRESVILSNSHAVGSTQTSTYETATVSIVGDNIRVFNLTIENCEYPNEKIKQAVAAYCLGDKMVFVNCKIDSYQDTLFLGPTPDYVNSNRKDTCLPIYKNEESLFRYYFYQCSIEGSFDYIFGAGVGYFDKCRLVTKLNDARWNRFIIVCNQKRENTEYGFVFQNCEVTYKGELKKRGFLGCSWRAAASVVWINCYMEDYFHNDRWLNRGDLDVTNLKFLEVCSSGDGAVSLSSNEELYSIRPVEYVLDYDKETVLNGWEPEITFPYLSESALLSAVAPSKPKLTITVDVEALKKRAESNHVNRLIYGNIDGDTWGIGRMMDVGDKYGVKISFFLDFASADIYGDEIIEAGKYILFRGHDLQLHFHPSGFSKSFWENIGHKFTRETDPLDSRVVKICVLYLLEQYAKCTSQKPVAFRAGSYSIYTELMEELYNNGITVDSSYHSNLLGGEPRGCFVWSNGMFEIPVSIEKFDKDKDPSVLSKDFNFNRTQFLPWGSTPAHFEAAVGRAKKFLNKYYLDYGVNSIATFVMHSWSLCVEVGNDYYDIPNLMYAEYFDYLIGELSKDFEIITVKDIADVIAVDKEYLESHPVVPFDAIYGCNVCGAQRKEIESYNNSTVPRRCKKCGSLERQRNLVSAMKKHSYDFANKEWLHISPSIPEKRIISNLTPKKTITIDIRPEVKVDITGDISKMPEVADASFDVVLMSNVLHHVYDDNAALGELYRVLRPNGVLLMEVNMSGKNETVILEDPTIWYGQEVLEKYKVGTFRRYGTVDLANQLAPYFTVESFKEIDEPSGNASIWHICIKK